VDVYAVERARVRTAGESPPEGAGQNLAAVLGDPGPFGAVLPVGEFCAVAVCGNPADGLGDRAGQDTVEVGPGRGTDNMLPSKILDGGATGSVSELT
jgi:hypothetical protein